MRRVIVICAFWVSLLAAMTACAPMTDRTPLPDAFGVTMVEETTCIGNGGQIVTGPQVAFCQGG